MEIWKDIPSYEDCYEINQFGVVRSKEREFLHTKGYMAKYKVRIMATTKSDRGDVRVHLSKNGTQRAFNVARLVATLFIRPPENGEEANHLDGNPENNNVDNLEWCTRLENMQHSWKTGLRDGFSEKVRGENNKRAIMTEEDVLYIREQNSKGVSQKDLIAKFKCSKACIQFICSRRTWKHI